MGRECADTPRGQSFKNPDTSRGEARKQTDKRRSTTNAPDGIAGDGGSARAGVGGVPVACVFHLARFEIRPTPGGERMGPRVPGRNAAGAC